MCKEFQVNMTRAYPVPMTVAYSSDNFTLSYTPPDLARGLIVGVSVDKLAALQDHTVLSFKHNEYQAVKTGLISDVEYGPHLGAIAGFVGDAASREGRKLKFWPGTMPVRGWPDLGIAKFPLRGGRSVVISGKRLFGATAIAKATLWVLPMAADDFSRVCDGRLAMQGAPFWLGTAQAFAAAAGTLPADIEANFDAVDGSDLMVHGLLAAAYSNTDSTWAYDTTYAEKLLLDVRDYGDAGIGPEWLNGERRLYDLAAAYMLDVQPERGPNQIVGWKEGLRIGGRSEGTAQIAELLLTLYGTLCMKG